MTSIKAALEYPFIKDIDKENRPLATSLTEQMRLSFACVCLLFHPHCHCRP